MLQHTKGEWTGVYTYRHTEVQPVTVHLIVCIDGTHRCGRMCMVYANLFYSNVFLSFLLTFLRLCMRRWLCCF